MDRLVRWGEARYHSLNYHLRTVYGEKLYKVSLQSGCTCPNRDGTLGTRGCIFCSAGGSGDFAAPASLPVSEQLACARRLIASKHKEGGLIAYFQSYTNTYGPVQRLKPLFQEALDAPDVRILSIATRPDCLDDAVLSMLAGLHRQKPVWVELGLQTIHEDTAAWTRRGYTYPVFTEAVEKLHRLGIPVIVHVILGLPGESRAEMLQTIQAVNALPVSGIKLQLLHVLRGTDLAQYYEAHPFWIPSMEEYFSLLCSCICQLRPDIVIHRLTGDGPKNLLIAPLWTGRKRLVLNALGKYMKEQDIWQGKTYDGSRLTPDSVCN